MAKPFLGANNATNRTINAIDRKRDRERRHWLVKVRDEAPELAVALIQRLMDEHIIETTSNQALSELMEKQLRQLIDMDEFDLQFKVAPLRSIVTNPNLVCLYLTQYIIEDLINHPKVQDIFGNDADIYRVVETVVTKKRGK
ncbi:MAG: hypothetical protein BWK76_04500 [Desulfobulbaceae bacterium A2]|nr:MAG: hypothetical protein BWK76_04500 [Desulfobulbaceae bacterium A2]